MGLGGGLVFSFSILSTPFVLRALVSVTSLDTSLALPQDDIDHPAKDSQREGHPGQDVGKAEGGVVCGGMPICVSHCEDGCAAHHT